jgi:hypothetical protein
MLDSSGLAGTADLLLAHALLTGGLFLAAGIVLATERSVDELQLRGRCRRPWWLGVLWGAGALALIGPPYVGDFLGHAQIDDAAAAAGRHWIPPLLWLASALAGAALLRAGAPDDGGPALAVGQRLGPLRLRDRQRPVRRRQPHAWRIRHQELSPEVNSGAGW